MLNSDGDLMSSPDHDHCLLRLLPEAFLPALVPAMKLAYRRTERAMLEFPDSEAADLRGGYRRAEVERVFSQVVRETGGECRAEQNHRNTSSFRLAHFGNVLLTVHKVGHVGAVPRHAEFRGELAWDGQFDLFREAEPTPADAERIYLVVTHGPHPDTFASPGFILLAQPDARFRSYHHQVELLSRFGGELDEGESLIPEETISPALTIKVRKSAAEDAG